MAYYGLLSALSKLSITLRPHFVRNIVTDTHPLLFKATHVLLAEPLKKKKKLDPAVIKQREDRRKKRLEKQIRRLQRHARQLKPIEECEVPMKLIDQKQERLRNLPEHSPEVIERRELLSKAWSKYKYRQHLDDLQLIDRVISCQRKALEELRTESEDLYQQAIQPEQSLIPYESKGVVGTPIIENYESPDGEYQDISKIWD